MKLSPSGLLKIALAAGIAIPASAQNAGNLAQRHDDPKGQTAGQYFKNVTTAALKDLTVSDFLGAMGVMTAAVGYDCSNCHPGAGTDNMDWVTDRVPQKVTARKMVDMVATINKQNFAGTQQVTCWTCHHGLDLPTTSIAMDKLYGAPNDEKRDMLPADSSEPAPAEILNQFVEAVGGAKKLAALKSYVATGESIGFSGLGGTAAFKIYAEAPNKRGMWIDYPEHPDRGISAWTYDGKTGWIGAPRGFLGTYELTGNDLAGARLDGIVSFPDQIKNAFPAWRSVAEDEIGDREVYVIQGSDKTGMVGTFYFDKKTHLLVRYVRRTPSPVGRITIQQDYDDYRDVDGIKFPFKYSFLWLDGRFTANIKSMKVNVPVEVARLGKP